MAKFKCEVCGEIFWSHTHRGLSPSPATAHLDTLTQTTAVFELQFPHL